MSVSGKPRTYADAEALKGHVTMLSETFHPRSAAHPENLQRVATYIELQFKKVSGRVSLQTFIVDGHPVHNVIAKFGPDTGRTIVIGAHYDSAQLTPGADDNASGVAGLIELSRLLADREVLQPIELVAFTLEEPPHFKTTNMGSYRHAQSLRHAARQVDYMIGLEMIGMFSDAPGSQRYPHPLMRRYFPDEGNFIAIVGRLSDIGVTRSLKFAMASDAGLPVISINSPREWLPIELSDHLNYWDAGFDAVMITDTAYYRNPNYHRATDIPETLDYKRMAMVVDAVLRPLPTRLRVLETTP